MNSQRVPRALPDRDAAERDVIAANVAGTRFGSECFIRKAIGCALREYAKTDPAWVVATVHDLGEKL